MAKKAKSGVSGVYVTFKGSDIEYGYHFDGDLAKYEAEFVARWRAAGHKVRLG